MTVINNNGTTLDTFLAGEGRLGGVCRVEIMAWGADNAPLDGLMAVTVIHTDTDGGNETRHQVRVTRAELAKMFS